VIAMRVTQQVEKTVTEEAVFLDCENGCGVRVPIGKNRSPYPVGWAFAWWIETELNSFDREPLAFCSWRCMAQYAAKVAEQSNQGGTECHSLAMES
jgi:hypothetical protein